MYNLGRMDLFWQFANMGPFVPFAHRSNTCESPKSSSIRSQRRRSHNRAISEAEEVEAQEVITVVVVEAIEAVDVVVVDVVEAVEDNKAALGIVFAQGSLG